MLDTLHKLFICTDLIVASRKKSFDVNVALHAAMEVFWQKGYVGASLAELTKRMGINKPSMYSTFGNKEALFIKAVQHYLETKMQPQILLLSEKGFNLKQRLKKHMMSVLELQCNSENTKGCLLILCQSEMAGGDIPKEAEQLLKDIDDMPNKLYTDFFNNDVESIEQGLKKNAEANGLTIYTHLKGAATMARSGVESSALEYSIDSVIAGIGVH